MKFIPETRTKFDIYVFIIYIYVELVYNDNFYVTCV
jgi:hypothetical protein